MYIAPTTTGTGLRGNVCDQLSLFDSRCQGLLAENAALARRGRRLDLRRVELAGLADGHNIDLRILEQGLYAGGRPRPATGRQGSPGWEDEWPG